MRITPKDKATILPRKARCVVEQIRVSGRPHYLIASFDSSAAPAARSQSRCRPIHESYDSSVQSSAVPAPRRRLGFALALHEHFLFLVVQFNLTSFGPCGS